jgi:hypothetical protein
MYFNYLTNLQEWGFSDMSEAAPELQRQFPDLDMLEARKILSEWSATKYQLLKEKECRV